MRESAEGSEDDARAQREAALRKHRADNQQSRKKHSFVKAESGSDSAAVARGGVIGGSDGGDGGAGGSYIVRHNVEPPSGVRWHWWKEAQHSG